ncbi:MAG: tmk [Sphingobacteriaceae bacterium]|jgi:dTMP kinase|nr:tmk [Sphingobacteriaceae bacterium]
MKQNLFIALEGIDGSGKSTQIKLLAEKLIASGHQVYSTFEPSARPIGAMIRSVLKGEMQMDDRAIAGLFVADRLDHLLNEQDGLLKKLKEGYTVLTDRYYFSSYAYHGTHMPMDWVIKANELSAQLLRPDVTIYIDISAEASMERINKGRNSTELYETTENLNNVRNNYFKAFDLLKDEEKVFITNGNRLAEEIAADIWEHVKQIK